LTQPPDPGSDGTTGRGCCGRSGGPAASSGEQFRQAAAWIEKWLRSTSRG